MEGLAGGDGETEENTANYQAPAEMIHSTT